MPSISAADVHPVTKQVPAVVAALWAYYSLMIGGPGASRQPATRERVCRLLTPALILAWAGLRCGGIGWGLQNARAHVRLRCIQTEMCLRQPRPGQGTMDSSEDLARWQARATTWLATFLQYKHGMTSKASPGHETRVAHKLP